MRTCDRCKSDRVVAHIYKHVAMGNEVDLCEPCHEIIMDIIYKDTDQPSEMEDEVDFMEGLKGKCATKKRGRKPKKTGILQANPGHRRTKAEGQKGKVFEN